MWELPRFTKNLPTKWLWELIQTSITKKECLKIRTFSLEQFKVID
ncbi:hypothetical protein LEP1GSC082_1290 [Leptospira kirschneri str. H2]|uniref:Uncharacterized protein n=2 Tax=Leptospira kirschneri TaxID=29507 RepID=A0A0E2B4I0_9LEPT|nr:hypothetical protein LEP1GSC081_3886 [Leptospira kirschneri str. H1]EKO62143.1 hypothetical protein LEP1GSC082_1290 [Leptospira kirschneri str. H2]EMK05850.1 hypothetical protein LEP1GSC166_1563 [Leptospira kirschneri]EMK25556.1 hypothetical protein LEP1GSC008_1187 [Leptospira kirschneri serovar Bulgarica str. Nikolaevo]